MSEEESTIEVPVLRNDEETLKERMSDNAYQQILPARYLKKNEDGEIIEEQEELFERVAKNIAVAEAVYENFDIDEKEAPNYSYDDVSRIQSVQEWADKFQYHMEHLKFIPNTPTLINAGTDMQQLSACFVDSPEDNLQDIGDTETEASLIFQSGGGVGYDFGKLRPYGDIVGSTGGIASGPITFMQRYDQNCETIAQGGVRRGAQMGTMQVTHPDIIHFIHAKNKDVSLAHTLRLNDPDDPSYTDFGEAIEEARELIDDEGRVPGHLRNAVEGHLSNFNISVTVTDDFMEALQNGERYTLINPRTGEPHIASEETKEMYEWFDLGDEVTVGEELTLPAEEIWTRVVEGAYENGEPGVMFIDTVNDEHSYDVEENPEYRMTTSNPCVAEGTLVNTPSGYEPVEEVEEGDEINTVYGSEKVDEVLQFDDEEVYKVEFSDGGVQYVTEDHRYHAIKQEGSYTKEVDDIPLRELEEGDKVRLLPNMDGFEDGVSIVDYDRGLKRGILLGDGGYTENTIDTNNDLSISTNIDDPEYNENLKSLFNTERKIDKSNRSKAAKVWVNNADSVLEELDLDPGYSHEKNFDIEDIETKEEAIGILDGLLASDGNVNLASNHPAIRFFTSSIDLAKNIRRLLLGLGCHGRITVEEAYQKSNGTIDGRDIERNHDLYTVHISGESLRRFSRMTNIEDIHPSKGEKLRSIKKDFVCSGNSWRAKIENIEPAGTETVYDLYCSGSDTWVTDGYIQRGCAEQNLMEYEACNLGHINLSTIVDKYVVPWSEYTYAQDEDDLNTNLERVVEEFLDRMIDWKEFDERIEVGTRFLDNVVTMSDFPIEEIEETVRKNRKIGLGIMGLAQLYIQLGVRYGSDVGNEVARQLMLHINHESKRVSHELALERGNFANWEDSKYAEPWEYEEWFDKHVGGDYFVYDEPCEMRNHNTTTIAPTGTTSRIGNTTGGCEPIYNVAFYKNVTDDIQGDEMLVVFDSLFLKTLERNDIDVDSVKEEAQYLMENNDFDGVEDLDTVPEEIGELFVTTGDLNSQEHASVMCALQDGVDSSISKTLNAPQDATLEDAKSTFEYVYKNGGKSVTFYRDGSRTKQVNTTRKDNQETGGDGEIGKEHEVPFHREAPDVLEDVARHRIRTGSGKLYVTIGEDEHGVVEVMATVGKSGGQTEAFTEALARQISQSLQWGVPVDEVIDQLENIKGPDIGYDGQDIVHSVPDGIALALKRYIGDKDMEIDHTTVKVDIADEEQSADASECPECGAMALVQQEGCNTCLPEMGGCSYSKCS